MRLQHIHVILALSVYAGRDCSGLTNSKAVSRTGLVKPIPSPLTKAKPYRATASTSWSAVSSASASDMSITGIRRLETLLLSLSPIFSAALIQITILRKVGKIHLCTNYSRVMNKVSPLNSKTEAA